MAGEFSIAGYPTQNGFMGKVPFKGWILFATEDDYFDYIQGLIDRINKETGAMLHE